MTASKISEMLRAFGYEVRQEAETEGVFNCTLSGGALEIVFAAARCTSEVCSVGILLGVLGAARPSSRYSLLIDALELNFQHDLARISLFRIPPDDEDEENANSAVFVAETSFFWPDLTKEKLDRRMKAIVRLAYAFSQTLASRDAMVTSNPWYERLRGQDAATS